MPTSYKIKKGDTLWDIARANNISVAKLAAQNNISNPSLIFPGQEIKVPTAPVAQQPPKIHGKAKLPVAPVQEGLDSYEIKSGDSLSEIAVKYGTTYQELARVNRITNPHDIKVGQRLKVPKIPEKPSIDWRKATVDQLGEFNKRTSNEDKIHAYHEGMEGRYIVEDKANHIITVYENGKPIKSHNTVSGQKAGTDDMTMTKTDSRGNLVVGDPKNNLSTPAGIFEIKSTGKFHGAPSIQRGIPGTEPYVKATKDTPASGSIFHMIPSSVHVRAVPRNKSACNRSTGCTGLSKTSLDDITKKTKAGDKWYILPEDDRNKFDLTGYGLGFDSHDTRKLPSYYPDATRDIVDVSIPESLKPKQQTNVRKAIDHLTSNKETIRKQLGLSSDQFDRLLPQVLGIMGRESGYDRPGLRGKVGYAKDAVARSFDKIPTSGPFQVRTTSLYPEEKERIGINESKDLMDISKGSEAAMTLLSNIYKHQVPKYAEDFPDKSQEEIALSFYANPEGYTGEGELRFPYANDVMENASQFQIQYEEGGQIKERDLRAASDSLTTANSDLPWIQRHQQGNELNIPDPYNPGSGKTSTHGLAYHPFSQDSAMIYPEITQQGDSLVHRSGDAGREYAEKNNLGINTDLELAKYYSQNGLIQHEEGGPLDYSSVPAQNPVSNPINTGLRRPEDEGLTHYRQPNFKETIWDNLTTAAVVGTQFRKPTQQELDAARQGGWDRSKVFTDAASWGLVDAMTGKAASKVIPKVAPALKKVLGKKGAGKVDEVADFRTMMNEWNNPNTPAARKAELETSMAESYMSDAGSVTYDVGDAAKKERLKGKKIDPKTGNTIDAYLSDGAVGKKRRGMTTQEKVDADIYEFGQFNKAKLSPDGYAAQNQVAEWLESPSASKRFKDIYGDDWGIKQSEFSNNVRSSNPKELRDILDKLNYAGIYKHDDHNVYLNMMADLTKHNPQTVGRHEYIHAATKGSAGMDNVLESFIKRYLPSDTRTAAKTAASELGITKKRARYLLEPTEVYARTHELRSIVRPSRKNTYTANDVTEGLLRLNPQIRTDIDEFIKIVGKDKIVELMNKLPSVGGVAVGGVAAYNSQQSPEHKLGGYLAGDSTPSGQNQAISPMPIYEGGGNLPEDAAARPPMVDPNTGVDARQWTQNWFNAPASQQRMTNIVGEKGAKRSLGFANQSLEDLQYSTQPTIGGDHLKKAGASAMYDPYQHKVYNPSGNFDTEVHETFHGTGIGSAEYGNPKVQKYIRSVPTTMDKKKVANPDYPDEVYARIMEIRNNQGFTPDQEITPEMLPQDRSGNELFENYDDEGVLNLLNNLADNSQQGQNNLPMARNGGRLTESEPIPKDYWGITTDGGSFNYNTNELLALPFIAPFKKRDEIGRRNLMSPNVMKSYGENKKSRAGRVRERGNIEKADKLDAKADKILNLYESIPKINGKPAQVDAFSGADAPHYAKGGPLDALKYLDNPMPNGVFGQAMKGLGPGIAGAAGAVGGLMGGGNAPATGMAAGMTSQQVAASPAGQSIQAMGAGQAAQANIPPDTSKFGYGGMMYEDGGNLLGLPEYSFGSWMGDNAGGILQGAGDAVSAIPVIGQIAGPILNMAGKITDGLVGGARAKAAEEAKALKDRFDATKAGYQGQMQDQASYGAFANGGDLGQGMMSKNPQIVNYSKGNTHQEGIGGIPVDARGNPSTTSRSSAVGMTEKGEVAWNGYIFSDKLTV